MEGVTALLHQWERTKRATWEDKSLDHLCGSGGINAYMYLIASQVIGQESTKACDHFG